MPACGFILIRTSNINRIEMPSHEQSNRLKEFCKDIVARDLSIRFAGVANQMGNLIESEYREGLKPLMNRQETEHYTMQTVFRASTRETFESKIGKQRYAIAVYEKIIRATIPIMMAGPQGHKQEKQQQQQQQKEQNSKPFYLLISFDLGSDVISIMEDKILPFVEQFRKH
jgi:hypothetical protein